MSINSDKILIEIAAYKDPELLNTVKSAIIQADNPDRIYFAICYQNDDLTVYDELKKINNCKIKYVKEKDSKGCCYARYLCQQLIDDEEYIYQIDSHMRFIKHWDTKMIEQLLALNDENAIISFYPPNCTEEMMSLPLDDKIFDNPASGGKMYIEDFRGYDSSFVIVKSELIEPGNKFNNNRSVLISGGNLFSFSKVHKDVISDPDMFFYGDELAIAYRLFTHGYNVYNSDRSYIYHQYMRKNAKSPTISNAMQDEEKRFQNLIKIRDDNLDFKEFGLGKKRSLDDFINYSGIDIKNRHIYQNAEFGEFENSNYYGKTSYFMEKEYLMFKSFEQNDTVDVLIVDYLDKYKECINNCLKNAVFKDRIRFIVGSTVKKNLSLDEKERSHIKKFIHFNSSPTYGQIVNKISNYIGSEYVTVIDSGIKFLEGWDKYLCDEIKMCGKNAALTSWVWEKLINSRNITHGYCNIIKELKSFSNYMPILHFNDSINLSDMTFPFQTPFISDGFLFCHGSVLKNIKYDPKLNYDEQNYIYSIRLWTNGINLYYPPLSYTIRIHNGGYFETNQNLDIVCALSGIKNYYSKRLEGNYSYDIGDKRPIWTWYNYLGINYDAKKKEIIEKNDSSKN